MQSPHPTFEFEFNAYSADDDGDVSALSVDSVENLTLSAAKSRAGTLAKRYNGPVDLAYSDGREWADRYVVTARPSEHHSKGYALERLN